LVWLQQPQQRTKRGADLKVGLVVEELFAALAALKDWTNFIFTLTVELFQQALSDN